MTTITLLKYDGSPYVINKSPTTVRTIEGQFRGPVSLMNPTVALSGDTINLLNTNQANYLEIEGRYYYITDWTIIPNNHIEVKLHLDVLYTYKTEIGQMQVLLARSSNPQTEDIPDGMHPLSSDKIFEIQHLPNQFSELEEDGTYIMVTSQRGYTKVE